MDIRKFLLKKRNWDFLKKRKSTILIILLITFTPFIRGGCGRLFMAPDTTFSMGPIIPFASMRFFSDFARLEYNPGIKFFSWKYLAINVFVMSIFFFIIRKTSIYQPLFKSLLATTLFFLLSLLCPMIQIVLLIPFVFIEENLDIYSRGIFIAISLFLYLIFRGIDKIEKNQNNVLFY